MLLRGPGILDIKFLLPAATPDDNAPLYWLLLLPCPTLLFPLDSFPNSILAPTQVLGWNLAFRGTKRKTTTESNWLKEKHDYRNYFMNPKFCNMIHLYTNVLKDMYLFFRERGREREREGEKHWCEKHQSVASHTHPQPRHVPWPGIELAIFHFVGQHPTNWATPAKVYAKFLNK